MGDTYIDFFEDEVTKNCSHEWYEISSLFSIIMSCFILHFCSPMQCERRSFPKTITVTSFPVPEYYQVMLLGNTNLAQKFFNMNSTQAFNAIESGNLSLAKVSSVLDKKTLAINIYYDDLSYTVIDEVLNRI